MAGLQRRLDTIREGFERTAPAEVVEVMHAATRELFEEIASNPGLGVGDEAPDFALPDQDCNVVDSKTLLSEGPLALSLFRGHW